MYQLINKIKIKGALFIEYAMVLSFIIVIGVFFIGNNGITDSISGIFSKTSDIVNGVTSTTNTLAQKVQQKMKDLYYTELASGGWYIIESQGNMDQKIKLGDATIVQGGKEYPLTFGRGVVSNKREPVEDFIKAEFGTNGYLIGFDSTTATSLREMMLPTTNIDTYTAGIKMMTIETGDKLENGTIPVTQYLYYQTKEGKNTVYKIYGSRTGYMTTDVDGNVQKNKAGALNTNKTSFYSDSSMSNKLDVYSNWDTTGY